MILRINKGEKTKAKEGTFWVRYRNENKWSYWFFWFSTIIMGIGGILIVSNIDSYFKLIIYFVVVMLNYIDGTRRTRY